MTTGFGGFIEQALRGSSGALSAVPFATGVARDLAGAAVPALSRAGLIPSPAPASAPASSALPAVPLASDRPAGAPSVPAAPAGPTTPTIAPTPTLSTGSAATPTITPTPLATSAQAQPAPQSASSASGFIGRATLENGDSFMVGQTDPSATVQGQLSRILSSDSPVLQQAQTRGAQRANERGLLNSSMGVQAGEAALYDAAVPIAQADANLASNLQLQNLRGAQSTQLAGIEAAYKTLIQSSDSAGKLYQQATDAINKTLLDTTLTPAAKDNAINQQVSLLRSGLSLIGGINNLDLAGLLDFEGV